MLSRTRVFVVTLLTCAAIGAAGSEARAQQAPGGLQLPITGMGDLGGAFTGTFLVRGFTVQGTSVAATGVVSGVMSDATGVSRNIVSRMSVPLDLEVSRARRNTDLSLTGASCEVLPLDFGAAAINVLGSTVAFAPASLDIAAAQQVDAVEPAVALDPHPGPVSSFGSPTPGTITTPRPAARAPQTDLGAAVCAASRLGTTGADRAQLVQALNQVIAALE